MNQTINCTDCAQSFEWERTSPYQAAPRMCPACTATEIRKNHREALSKVQELVAKQTPSRFQTTDTAHADFNARLWDRIQPWRPTTERPWLGMIGATGKCKTRCAYLLLKDLAAFLTKPSSDPYARPRVPAVQAATAYQFAEIVTSKFGNETGEAKAALMRLRNADLLLLDDIGKQRNTPALSSELFAILDHRHAENLTTIWTANSTPEAFLADMASDMSAPLAGRIRESSTILNITDR